MPVAQKNWAGVCDRADQPGQGAGLAGPQDRERRDDRGEDRREQDRHLLDRPPGVAVRLADGRAGARTRRRRAAPAGTRRAPGSGSPGGRPGSSPRRDARRRRRSRPAALRARNRRLCAAVDAQPLACPATPCAHLRGSSRLQSSSRPPGRSRAPGRPPAGARLPRWKVQKNGTPRRKPRNRGGSPSGVSEPPMLATRKMKKTTVCAAVPPVGVGAQQRPDQDHGRAGRADPGGEERARSAGSAC